MWAFLENKIIKSAFQLQMHCSFFLGLESQRKRRGKAEEKKRKGRKGHPTKSKRRVFVYLSTQVGIWNPIPSQPNSQHSFVGSSMALSLVHKASHSRCTASSSSGLGYDIFLSFRGEDTRKNFTDHLHTALLNSGFRTFRDHPELKKGENIKEELGKAIRESQSFVIVFSKGYASSKWCLDELVMILERKRTCNHFVLPVFYDVDPSHLRKQTGNVAQAFTEHQKTQSSKKLNGWRAALEEVADLAGMNLQNEADGHESKFIQKIVTVIQEKLGRVLLSDVRKELEEKLLSVNPVLDDAERKLLKIQTTVMPWLHKLKEAVCEAEDLLQEIETEALRQKIEHEYGSSTSVQELVSTPSHAFDSCLTYLSISKHIKDGLYWTVTVGPRAAKIFKREILDITSWIYCRMKRRMFKQLKEKYFKDNGGFLLQQRLKNSDGLLPAKIFTIKELKKATNNFDDSRKIGEGGYGVVYRGTLPDKEVAIKASKSNAPMTQSNQFINEVIVLSQINHRNIVKLLGCCLETQTPLLVYEFISNGTLYEHIHEKNGKEPLSFGLRMRIAAETARALAYLHYSTSMQIVHRDVKTTNILLDHNFKAKVSDFGASKLVPEDQNQLSTLVQGTLGYLDPEYLLSNILTEKSDVYSFGVVLVELITSQVPISFYKPVAERNLASFFVTLVEENCLDQILDLKIITETSFEIVKQVAYLAKRCLSVRGRDRPTMEVVVVELEEILKLIAEHPGGKPDASPEETDYLLATSPAYSYVVGVRCDEGEVITSIDYDQSTYDQSM